MDRAPLHPIGRGLSVNGLAQDVKHAPQGRPPHRDPDRMASIEHRQAPTQTSRTAHGHRSHGVRVNVLLHLKDQFRPLVTLNQQCIVDAGQVA